MDVYSQIAERIIKQQETIIGPVAIEQAQQVQSISVDWDKHKVAISGDASNAINSLVGQYKKLFGQTSVEVCKEAAGSLLGKLTADQIPASLK